MQSDVMKVCVVGFQTREVGKAIVELLEEEGFKIVEESSLGEAIETRLTEAYLVEGYLLSGKEEVKDYLEELEENVQEIDPGSYLQWEIWEFVERRKSKLRIQKE